LNNYGLLFKVLKSVPKQDRLQKLYGVKCTGTERRRWHNLGSIPNAPPPLYTDRTNNGNFGSQGSARYNA